MLEIYINNHGLFQENTYFVRDAESGDRIIIDPGFFDEAAVNAIEDKSSVKYIIATHTHMDHVKALKQYRSAFPNAIFLFCKEDIGHGENITADRYLKYGDKLAFGNGFISAITTPGHTPGGICLLIEDVLFSGDTLFQRSVGRTDLSGGDWEALQKSIKEKLFTLPEKTRVLPGHGDETSIEIEKKANPFV